MKNILFLFFATTLCCVSQNTAIGDFAAIEVRTKNATSDTLVIKGKNKFLQQITANAEGKFISKINVIDGFYQLSDGKIATILFLKNGFELIVHLNFDGIDNKIVYEGKGAKENNFFIESSLQEEKFETSGVFEQDNEVFTKALGLFKKETYESIANGDYDAGFKVLLQQMKAQYFQYMPMQFADAQLSKQLIGSTSPSFDYENHKGGKKN